MTALLRPASPADLPAIHRVNDREERHDGIPLITPLAEILEWTDEPHFDLATDARVAEVEGEIVGWGRIWHRPSGVGEERAFLMGAVDPAHRGQGVGRALIQWQIERARELLGAIGNDLPRFIRASRFDFDASAIRLFTRQGMVPVRYGNELLRPLDEPFDPVEIPGIMVTPYSEARSEEARAAHNEAFADHWGYTPRDAETWQHELQSFGSRLDLSFLALDGERVVGVCLNNHFPDDETLNGRRDGWIHNVSVVRSHRKRGIASALIIASLTAFRGAGFTHSALGVDTENPTRAFSVYERLGYRPLHRHVTYQLAV